MKRREAKSLLQQIQSSFLLPEMPILGGIFEPIKLYPDMNTSCITLIATVTMTVNLMADNWMSFRGTNGQAVSSETNLPLSWDREKNVAWKVGIPGKGTSSPIVHGDRVYITSQVDDRDLHVLSFDLKRGQQLWNLKLGSGRLPTHQLHNMATPTPVTDGKHLWILFGTGDLICLNAVSGEEQWRRNLRKDYGDYKINHGMGSSPVLYDDKLFIACMHQGPSYVLALDASNGMVLWKKARDLEAHDEGNDSYSTPILVEVDGNTQLVLSGAEHLNAYDPATGREIWKSGGMRVPHPYGRTISGPAAGAGKVVTVASGFRNQGFMLGVTPKTSETLSEVTHDWTIKRYSPDCSTPLIYRGMVFAIRDDGMASCIDLETGQAHWQERLFKENVKVSPIAADGYVYFTSGRANTKVIKASKKLELVSLNELNEETLATPAISDGRVIVRTFEHLYCIRRP